MTLIAMGSVGRAGRACRTAVCVLATLFQIIAAKPTILPEDAVDYVSAVDLLDYGTATENSTDTSPDDVPSGSDSMSIMWYLVSFAGLVTFFLLLSFSEFCCKKTPELNSSQMMETVEPPAPPPYELFAPPSYESLFRDITRERKRSITVFLVPVHDKAEIPRESPLEFGEVIRRNPMGDGEVVTPPPPP